MKKHLLCAMLAVIIALLPIASLAAPVVRSFTIMNGDEPLSIGSYCTLEIVTDASVQSLSLSDATMIQQGGVTGMSFDESTIHWTYSILCEHGGTTQLSLSYVDALGEWVNTPYTFTLLVQGDTFMQQPAGNTWTLPNQSTTESAVVVPAPTWDDSVWLEYYATPNVEEGKRYSVWTGPGSKYTESGSYLPSKTRKILAFFKEKGNGHTWAYIDFEYRNAEIRRGYVRISQVILDRNIPLFELTLTPAVITQPVTPRYGPGSGYDEMPDSLRSGYQVQAIHEENNYVFIEYTSSYGLSRAWVPSNSISAN